MPTSVLVLLICLIWLYALMINCSANFDQYFQILWGNDKAKVLNNGELVTLSLDTSCGSGFQSKNEYLFGKLNMQIKLVPANSAGTVTSYYLSSKGGAWDEIDFEFLGNTSGDPYTIHTNVITQGKGDREQQFHLWFDPTLDFHNYSILWNPLNIIWFVDGWPIREFKNMNSNTIPYPEKQPMRLYASLWDGEDWATRGGLVKTDWTKAPFSASFRGFNNSGIKACLRSNIQTNCDLNFTNPTLDMDHEWLKEEPDGAMEDKLKWVINNYMIYNYCTDTKRFPRGQPPECVLTTSNTSLFTMT